MTTLPRNQRFLLLLLCGHVFYSLTSENTIDLGAGKIIFGASTCLPVEENTIFVPLLIYSGFMKKGERAPALPFSPATENAQGRHRMEESFSSWKAKLSIVSES